MNLGMCFRKLFFLPLLLSLHLFLHAQSSDGKISGLVLDPTGGVITDAEVLAVDDVTGVKTSARTNRDGIYVFPNLAPGPYRLQVSRVGFKTIIKPDILLNVQRALSINFTLPIGAVSETVTVEGGTSLVNTTDGSVGTVVDRQFVENIPLNGRSFQSLITLTPGVILVPGGSNAFGQFSVNGQRSGANNFSVDGVSANFGAVPGSFGAPNTSGGVPGFTVLGTTQSLASIDSLQEFRVQTSTYSAEYGRQPGGQISILTRSGTNQLHGSLFEYFRNDALDANDWFADRSGKPKPAERQNDFGGTFGGPVVIPHLYNGHDRTFFFFSYEGLRLRQPQFSLTNVPTLALRQAAPPALQPILNGFPLPNGKDLGNGLAEFTAGFSNPSTLDAVSIRIDHSLNTKVNVFARYNKAPSKTVVRANLGLASGVQPSRLETQTITIGATATLNPRSSNELRLNYSGNGAYQSLAVDDFGGAIPPPRNTLIPDQYDSSHARGSLNLQFSGLTAAIPQFTILDSSIASQRAFNVVDNFSHVMGAHQLKFGFDYRRLTPVGLPNSYVLTGRFFSQQQILSATAGSASIGYGIPLAPVFLNFSGYAQDTWNATRRLTLDMGLRWELNPAPSEANGHLPLAASKITNLATMQLAPAGTKEYKTTYNNFAPRFGVAYQLSQAPGRETVVRGGVGIFYDTGNDAAALNFNGQFPYRSNRTLSNVTYPLGTSQVAPAPLPIDLALTPPYPSNLALFDPALQLPYTWQWNIALEQSLGKDQALTVSYVGAAGRRLLQLRQLNLTAINPNFSTIFLTQGSATSDYDALQAQFQRQLARGLQALISYTWAHALDDDSSSLGLFAPQRGNASFDIRHILSAAATYGIPAPPTNSFTHAILGSWFIDTSVHAQSALPVDLVARLDVSPADGSLINIRPNLNSGVPLYVSCACPGGREINRQAFSIPPAGQFGNFGRNQARALAAWQQDFALRREFLLYENLKLQFRAEAFNVYNHPNFGAVQTSLTAANFGQATNALSAQLGGISQLYQIGGPRSLQLALKLVF